MKLIIGCITVNAIIKAKISNEEVVKHLNLVPVTDIMSTDGIMLYNAELDLTSRDFTLSNKHTGTSEYVVIDIHSVGSIELDIHDFSMISLW